MTFVPNSNKSALQVTDEPLYKSEVPAYITPSSGRVAFGGATAGTLSGNANFLWDNVNERLSVATTTAVARINIGASTATVPSVRFTIGVCPTVPVAGDLAFGVTSSANHFCWYDGSTHFKFGQLVGTTTTSALYMNEATPSATNFTLTKVSGGNTTLNSPTNVLIQIGGTSRLSILGGASELTSSYIITANSGIRGSTGNPLDIGYNSTQTLSSGYSITSRNVRFLGNTYNDTSALAAPASAPHVYFEIPTFQSANVKTIADAATVAINGAPIQATNLTITRALAFWVKAGLTKFDGGLMLNYVTKTASYNIASSDHTIDFLSGVCTATLPAATNLQKIVFAIHNTNATLTVQGTGGELINGSLTQSVPAGSTIYVQCTGTGWIII
jgi:hypothetical protein